MDLFLKIDGIQGESSDSKHKDEIQLESFRWGESRPSVPSGGASRRVQIEDFQFAMETNKASPQLLLACASGQHVKSAVLTAQRTGTSGKDEPPFLKYTFTDVLVSSFRMEGTPEPVVDHVSFNFGRIAVEYHPRNPDGSLGPPIMTSWDVKGNRPGA